MSSAARSSRIIAIIASMARGRTSGSQSASGCVLQARAEFGLERLADRLQIVAGIEPLGDRADVLAERLAVAQEGRAGEHVHLGAGVVDVIFARRLPAGEGEEARQRVAEHRAARVADMHRPGRVGADIFDVDRPGGARARPRRSAAPAVENGAAAPSRRPRASGTMLMKPGPGDLGLRHVGLGREIGGEALGERARVRAGGLGLLGVDHGGVGREVAMRGVARRLDDEAARGRGPAAVRPRRSASRSAPHARLEIRENVHSVLPLSTDCAVATRPLRRGRARRARPVSDRVYRAASPRKNRARLAQVRPARQKGGRARGPRSGRSCRRCSRRPRAPGRPPRPCAAQSGGMRGRVGDDRPETGARTIASALSRTACTVGMAVHVGEQERLDVPVGRLERRRMGDERPARRSRPPPGSRPRPRRCAGGSRRSRPR